MPVGMDALNRTIKALKNAEVAVWVVIGASRSSVEWRDGILAEHGLMV